MAINTPIVDAGPTKPRGHVLDQRFETYEAPPGGSYRDVVDGVVVTITVDPPTRVGQIYFYPQTVVDFSGRTCMLALKSTLCWHGFLFLLAI